MNFPVEIMKLILKIKWWTFRVMVLKEMEMPIYEAVLDPQFMRCTRCFCWFTYENNHNIKLMYSFKNAFYYISATGDVYDSMQQVLYDS